jgi:hypothetical protein
VVTGHTSDEQRDHRQNPAIGYEKSQVTALNILFSDRPAMFHNRCGCRMMLQSIQSNGTLILPCRLRMPAGMTSGILPYAVMLKAGMSVTPFLAVGRTAASGRQAGIVPARSKKVLSGWIKNGMNPELKS